MSSRGIRNNNPGNIVKSRITFQGQAQSQSDDRFVTFAGPEWGLRAMAKILLSYEREGVDTVRKIVSRWAPPSENQTAAYVKDVAARVRGAAGHVGVDPDARLDLSQAEQMVPMLQALVRHENGCDPYPLVTYIKAVQLAGLAVKSVA